MKKKIILTLIVLLTINIALAEKVALIELEYKDGVVEVLKETIIEGYIPSDVLLSSESYSYLAEGQAQNFSSKFEIPLTIFSDRSDDDGKISGIRIQLNKTRFTIIVPILEKKQEIKIYDPESQTVVETTVDVTEAEEDIQFDIEAKNITNKTVEQEIKESNETLPEIRTSFELLYGQYEEGKQLNVGRIYGLTSSDVSATVARSIFYDELPKKVSLIPQEINNFWQLSSKAPGVNYLRDSGLGYFGTVGMSYNYDYAVELNRKIAESSSLGELFVKMKDVGYIKDHFTLLADPTLPIEVIK